METRKGWRLGADLAGPMSEVISLGVGPTPTAVRAIVQDAGVDPDVYPSNRRALTFGAFDDSDDGVARRLFEAFNDYFRSHGFYENDSEPFEYSIDLVRKIIEKHGGTLTISGQVSWSSSPQAPKRSMRHGSFAAAEPSTGRTEELAVQRIYGASDLGAEAPNEQAVGVARTGPTSPKNTIFIVYGHDKALRNEIQVQLHNWKIPELETVILDNLASGGLTLLEKFEKNAAPAKFAIVIATPDDFGGKNGDEPQPRARQNVILEMGYFLGRLGRQNVVFVNAGVEHPSDLNGLLRVDTSDADWKLRLAKELNAAGIPVNVLA